MPSPKEEQPLLPVYCRFADLVEANIAPNWPTLLRMVDQENFPAGVMLSANIRAWDVEQVRLWLASRPSERKVVAPKRRRDRAGAAS